MKTQVLFVALLAVASSVHAQTAWEVGGGIAIAQAQHDGIWYQKPFPHQLTLTTPAIEIGTRTSLSAHWAVNTRAYWLGRNESYALAVSDLDYSPTSPTGCVMHCPKPSTYYGRGSVGGLSAMLEWHTAGAWQWGFAVGPVVYRESWTVDSPDWYPSQNGEPLGPVTPVHISATKWEIRPRGVLRLTHNDWYASLTYGRDGADLDPQRYFPPVWKSHVVLMIGQSF